MGAEAHGAGGRRRCWRSPRRWPPPASCKAFGIAFLGRPRTPRRAKRAARSTASRSPRWSRSPRSASLAGILPGLVIDALAPVVQALIGAHDAGAERPALAVDRADRRRAAAPITACWCSCSSPPRRCSAAWAIHRFASRALRRGAGLGLRLSRCQPRSPNIPADSFAQPIRRVFGDASSSAPARRVDMPPPGDPRPARFTSAIARPGLGRALRAGRPAPSASRRPAQPSAVPDHPPLSQPRLPRPRRPAAGARDMAADLSLVVQGAQMALVLPLAPLLTGFVRKVKARLLRRRGAAGHPALSRPPAAAAQGSRCSPRTPPGCSASRPT